MSSDAVRFPGYRRTYPDFRNSAPKRSQVIDFLFTKAKGRHYKVPVEVSRREVYAEIRGRGCFGNRSLS